MFTFSSRRKFIAAGATAGLIQPLSLAFGAPGSLSGRLGVAFQQAGELADQIRCLDADVANLPPQVREWIQSSAIARGGVSRIRVCAADPVKALPYEDPQQIELRRGFDELRGKIREFATQSGSRTQPMDFEHWLSQCSFEPARKAGFPEGVHAEYANPFELRSNEGPFFLTFASGSPALQIADRPHPWMSIAGYSPEVTLNNTELAALLPAAAFFDKNLRFYGSDRRMAFTPFPDTARLAVDAQHQDNFRGMASRARLNPKDLQLRYVRYYVTASVSDSGHTAPVALMAYAYTKTGQPNLAINFSIVPLGDKSGRRA